MVSLLVVTAHVAFCIFYATCAVYAAWLVSKVRRGSLSSWQVRCSYVGKWCLTTRWHTERKVDPLASKVMAMVDSRRLARTREVFKVMTPIVLLYFLCITAPRWFSGIYGWPDDRSAMLELLNGHTVEGALFAVVSVSAQVWPQRFTARTIDIFHAAFAIKMMVHSYSAESVIDIMYQNGTMLLMRLLFAISFGNAPTTTIINAAIAVANSLIYTYLAQRGGECFDPSTDTFVVVSWECLLFEGHENSYANREFFGFLGISAIAWVVEGWTRTEAQAALNLKASTQAETTVRTILSATCDAVLHLGSDLHVLHPSPALATLLLKYPSAEALRGENFLNLVSEADRPRLVAHFAPGHSHIESTAPMLHLDLRDANASIVRIQLFSSSFSDMDDKTCYVIGIRELNEGGRELPELQGVLAALPAARPDDSRRGPRSGSGDTFSSGCPFVWQVLSVEAGEEAFLGAHDVAAWVGLDIDLSIKRCNANLMQLGGPSSAGSSLLDWVPGEKNRADFLCWVQTNANQFVTMTGIICATYDLQEGIRLWPPGLPQLEFRGKCLLVLQDTSTINAVDTETKSISEGSSDADPLSLCVIFRDITRHHRKRNRHERSNMSRHVGMDRPKAASADEKLPATPAIGKPSLDHL